MTKLRITHFHDPEPPKLLDNPHAPNLGSINPEWEAWEARQVKPTFDYGKKGGFNKETIEAKKALQHYEENRKRYDGFVLDEDFSRDGNRYCFDFEELTIYISAKTDYVELDLGSRDYRNTYVSKTGISVSLFELICEENGIQLNKIETK